MPGPNPSIARGPISQAALRSFLGDNRILEILDPAIESAIAGTATMPVTRLADKPIAATALSENTMNLIVDRVVRKMSPEVIREVAWEVVPELSETIIRQTIKEKQ